MPSDDKPPGRENGPAGRPPDMLRLIYVCRRCGFNIAEWMEFCPGCGLVKGHPG